MAQRWRVSTDRPSRRSPRPLDAATLEALALRYVGRYATTRAKLHAYLARKIGERGWTDEMPPATDRIVERFTELSYVDDRAFATMRGAALIRRGFGKRRIAGALRAAGISEDDGADAGEAADASAWDAALTFARRKRIGPFATAPADRIAREKAIAAMIRAGHDFALARKVVATTAEELTRMDSFL